jgi:catechol 2,3-dioxygenase-like lactoylglutathione lyase family enzyme
MTTLKPADGNPDLNPAQEEPHVLGIYHVNINVSDLDQSRAFYERLGFRLIEAFGQAGEPDLDRGLGLPYTDTRAYFMGFGRRFETVIDLVEWHEPRAVGGAPPRMYDLGVPRLALRVKQLDNFYHQLKASGVEFLSEPQTLRFLKRASRFVCCRDPDGLIIELVELLPKSP